VSGHVTQAAPGWSTWVPFGGPWLARAVDAILLVLLLAVGFLLGYCELYDGDVWWHLAGGRWILEHGRVPGLDPFTFGSADRVWVDLNWLFQVPLALLYGQWGMAAVILLVAAVGTAALATAWLARDRSWPVVLGLLGWVPALVLISSRLLPRPEMFTLLYLAAFLAVFWRADRRPVLLWLLPPLQVLWVNTHGVFILGPLVVLFYVVDRWLARVRRQDGPGGPARREWKHLGPAAVLVVLACLANPYFLDGALFPFVLLPKVTAAGNAYKNYIAEFASPRDIAQRAPGSLGLFDACTRALVFLLLVLPVSFVLPAAWEARRRAAEATRKRGPRDGGTGWPAAWLGALAAAVAVSVLAAAALPGRVTARWLLGTQIVIPLCFLLLGCGGAYLLRGQSRAAAAWALCGGIFEAAWVCWLRAYLLEPRLETAPPSLVIAALTGTALAVGVVMSRPGGLLRLLLAGAFGYLALQAVRNASLFGLVAAVVLAWNLGEWVAALREVGPGAAPGRVLAWGLRLGGVALLGLWVFALATDRYYPWTGQPQRLGLSEKPFLFAHDAARFAGRDGMPDRALALNISQAGVYDFHNAPARKTFMDPRLEVPRRETFARYVAVEGWLRQQDRRWAGALHEMGDPLVLVWHPFHAQPYTRAEAALLAEGGWRCVYFDAVASVFIPRPDTRAGRTHPGVDFAGRLFRPDCCPVVPDQPGAALREAEALLGMAAALRLPSQEEARRTAVLLGALGRAGRALREQPTSGEAWSVLGDCLGKLPAGAAPPRLIDGWDAARLVPCAQAAYCYRRACELAPDEVALLNVLYDSLRARQLSDAQLTVAERLRALGKASPQQHVEAAQLRQVLADAERRFAAGPLSPAEAVMSRLRAGQAEAVVRLAEQASHSGPAAWDDATADGLAAAYLHLGRPEGARLVWERAAPSSSPARLCRLAATYWAEQELEPAIRLYWQVLARDPRCVEAWWALAVIHTQQGRAEPALEACRTALGLQPTDTHRAGLQLLQELLPRYATPHPD
jgi:tetratricopeptide (TPR) repeat protein